MPRLLIVALAALAAVAARAQTDVPATLAFQGALSDAAGQPVADGSYAIEVRLFEAISGGTAGYAEAHDATTRGGAFSVLIGTGTPVSGSFADVAFDRALWVELAVGGTTLAPRTALQATPYARGLTPGARVTGAVPDDGGTPATPRSVLSVENTAMTGYAFGVIGRASSSTGAGVFGEATTTTGGGIGVRGSTSAPSGRAVFGDATTPSGPGIGVSGLVTSPSGYGVHGASLSTTGLTYGVYGSTRSVLGRGVQGASTATTGLTMGVVGTAASEQGIGVSGSATATAGSPIGVNGEAVAPNGRGVYGNVFVAGGASGAAAGVYGETNGVGGRGVYGEATAVSGRVYGVYGRVTSADGFAGYFEGGRGVAIEGDLVVTGSITANGSVDPDPPSGWGGDVPVGALIEEAVENAQGIVFRSLGDLGVGAVPSEKAAGDGPSSSAALLVKRRPTGWDGVSPVTVRLWLRPTSGAGGEVAFRVVARSYDSGEPPRTTAVVAFRPVVFGAESDVMIATEAEIDPEALGGDVWWLAIERVEDHYPDAVAVTLFELDG